MDQALNELSYQIIGASIEVHRTLGPGLLESAYRDCLCREFDLRNIPYEKEKALSIAYKGISVSGFRADIIVSGQIIVELKAVAAIEPIFRAQLFSYLKASRIKLGILINFNVLHLANGIYRIINGF